MQDKERESFVLYVNKNNPNDKKVLPLKTVQSEYMKNSPIFNEIPKIDASSRMTLSDMDPDIGLISFAPPHDTPTRARLANMYEADPSVKRIIKFFTSYVYGTKPKQRIVPLQTETPPKKSDLDEAVDKILGKKEHKKFKEFVAKVDELSDIHVHARRLYQQSFVYGTSVGWKSLSTEVIKTPETNIEIPIKTPILIKPINGFQLGDIYQNVETFQPKFYSYKNQHQALKRVVAENGEVFEELVYRKDAPKFGIDENKPLRLPIERLIIFDRENAGVTPDTYYYGMSPLLPLIYHSENIRRIDQKILPELNETSYAPVGIFKVGQESPWNLEQLAAELSVAGNKIVINSDIEYQEVKIDSKLDQILNEKDVLKKDLLMGTGMPSSIFNSEEMTNRATAEITVNIFKSVTLDDERNFINEIMWKYWYRDLLSIFFKGEKYLDLEVKVELEFPARTFTPYIDKAQANRETYLNGGMTLTEWRVGNDLPPIPEEELKIPESADQKSNFGNQMGGNPNSDGSGSPTNKASPVTKNNTKQGSPKPPSGNQNLQGNQNTVEQTKQVITTKKKTGPSAK